LRLAFTDWGLPQQLPVDHAAVFAAQALPSPFPTPLHLWLLALGVELIFTRPARPTDQGMTERSHRLWNAQEVEGQTYPDWHSLYGSLRTQREFLNRHLPCTRLHDQPPLLAFPHACHSHRPYRPEWEARLLELSRVYTYLSQGHWFRRVSQTGTFALGAHTYSVGRAWAGQQIEITFDPSDQHLLCGDSAARPLRRLPLKGVSTPDLMGEFATTLDLPFFQFALPFPDQPHAVLRLFETLGA